MLLVPAVLVVIVAGLLGLALQGRPVFFVQERVGRDGRLFRLVKLRTMRVAGAPDAAGPVAATRATDRCGTDEGSTDESGDGFPEELVAGRAYRERHRTTRYGRVLRTLRVDEVPQLANVLTGSMSLIGPRPLLPEHVAAAGGGGERHRVRPGFTCHAQLELAARGYLDRYHQVRLDERYVRELGPGSDLAILGRTLLLPFRRRRTSSDHAGEGTA